VREAAPKRAGERGLMKRRRRHARETSGAGPPRRSGLAGRWGLSRWVEWNSGRGRRANERWAA